VSTPPLFAGLRPMEARSVAALPKGEGWQFEPKWDGFRCLALRQGATVELRGKSGKPLGRFFPQVCDRLAALPTQAFARGSRADRHGRHRRIL
jgi:ATP-dependent DNA ligase